MLRRTLAADGRSRAFVNDQPASVGVLRELGALLLEVHGQHETVGLLDAAHPPAAARRLRRLRRRGRRPAPRPGARWRAAREQARGADDADAAAPPPRPRSSARAWPNSTASIPREGEETELAEERALLGAAEKTLADIAAAARGASAAARSPSRLGQALRALERARERALAGRRRRRGPRRCALIAEAVEAVDRALVEAAEAEAAVDAAAEAFDFEPDRLEKAEERLFALRAVARKLGVAGRRPAGRARRASPSALQAIENGEEALADGRGRRRRGPRRLSRRRRAALSRRAPRRRRPAGRRGRGRAGAAEARQGPLPRRRRAAGRGARRPGRRRPGGSSRSPPIPARRSAALGAIASGGELARFALALKAALAGRGGGRSR